MAVFAPESEAELAALIMAARQPFCVQSHGTKQHLGHEVDADILTLRLFSGVTLYEPEELVIEVGAGTPLADVENILAQNNQCLGFEPPDYSALSDLRQRGSIGAVLACNLSGPRRLTAGAARDHILGLRGVSGRGEIFKGGGRVVKNVTGYDMPRLLAGSFGTLAALTSVTFKVLPMPETEVTLLVHAKDVAHAGAVMRSAMQLPFDVSSAANVPGQGVYLRLEGIGPSVADRQLKLQAKLMSETIVLEKEKSSLLWQSLRDLKPLAGAGDEVLWRISVAPEQGPRLIEKLQQAFDLRYMMDWSGGLVWLAVPLANDGQAHVIRNLVKSGHATVMQAGTALRRRIAVFQPQPPGLAALTARVKQAFDPGSLLNPGRMYREV
jgi:glycolate oxidase FAD binding subunit